MPMLMPMPLIGQTTPQKGGGGSKTRVQLLGLFAYSAGPLQTGAPASLLCAKMVAMMASSQGEVQVLRGKEVQAML